MTNVTRAPARQVLRIVVVLGALLLLGIALAVRPRSHDATDRPDSHSGSGPAALPSREVLDSSLRAIAAGESTLARDRWDPKWLAARLGSDPERVRSWVRNYTAWIPYHGVLRGPAGVLMDRQGNALDRALLLAALLRESGHTVRLAHTDLGRELALGLLPSLVALRRGAGLPWLGLDSTVDWQPSVRDAARRFGLDADQVEQSLARRLDSTSAALDALDRRTVDQTRRLSALLPAPSHQQSAVRVDRYVEALRDHWWVQRLDSGGWVDLDVLPVPFDQQPHPQASEVVEVGALPDSMYHRVAVRLVTERWADGAVAEQVAFQAEVKPSEVLGLPIGLQIWPAGWPADVLPAGADPRAAVRATALEQREWRATLLIGKDAAGDAVLEESGAVRAAAAGGPMGGLGRGIASALGGDRPNGGILSAAWLEYEVLVPGESPRRERRVLFDLPGPAARASRQVPRPALEENQRLIRSLALMRETDLLVLGSVPDPEFVLHLAAVATQTNVGLARLSRVADSAGAPGTWMAVAARAVPVQRLYTLALARFAWDTRGEVFLDRPNLLSQHDYLAPVADGVARMQANDIVLNDVGVALDVENERATRIGQGVRDTNGETLFPLGTRPAESVAAAFTKGEWVTLVAPSDPVLASLKVSGNARQRMIEDLSAGQVIVVPRQLSSSGGDGPGWWRIDPTSGHTLGVSSIGWGEQLLERFVEYGGAFTAGWAFEYLICRNGLYGLPVTPTAVSRGFTDPASFLVTPAVAQTGYCSINALIAGIASMAVQGATSAYAAVLKYMQLRGYLGWVTGRPLISAGAGAARGGTPSTGRGTGTSGSRSGAPPEECVPGAGGASERPSGGSEPVGEGPGAPPAPVEPEPLPPTPYDGPEPYEPAYVEQQREAARQTANEAEEQFQEALKAYRQAASEVKKPPSEAALEAEEAAGKNLALANAERAAARNNQLTWERMGAVNDELIAAREEAAAANEAMRKQLTAGGEWNGPAYERWAGAVSRLTNAERNFNFARFGRSAGGPGALPPNSQGQTKPLPPELANTQPASGEPATGPGASEQPPAGACKQGGESPGAGKPPTDGLAQARRAVDDAQRQYKAAKDAFEASNEAFFAAEQKALESGQPVPDQTPEYRARLLAKIDAMARFDRMRTKYFEAGGKPSDLPPVDAVAGSGSMAGIAGAGSGRTP